MSDIKQDADAVCPNGTAWEEHCDGCEASLIRERDEARADVRRLMTALEVFIPPDSSAKQYLPARVLLAELQSRYGEEYPVDENHTHCADEFHRCGDGGGPGEAHRYG